MWETRLGRDDRSVTGDESGHTTFWASTNASGLTFAPLVDDVIGAMVPELEQDDAP